VSYRSVFGSPTSKGCSNTFAPGFAHGLSASWWGNGLPRRRRVPGLRGRSGRMALRHGPYTYGWQQSGILRNGRKSDAATPREGRMPSGCKPLLISDRIGFVYYFYVLKSKKTSRFYYGLTSDLKRRLEEHNEGKSRSTKRGRPWKLVYYEAYLSVDDARRRELSVKNYGNVLTYIKRRISESIKEV